MNTPLYALVKKGENDAGVPSITEVVTSNVHNNEVYEPKVHRRTFASKDTTVGPPTLNVIVCIFAVNLSRFVFRDFSSLSPTKTHVIAGSQPVLY